MTSITFVKTRHVYDSYTDFWKLVELAGFPTIYVDELDLKQPGVFITAPMNGEWRPHIDNQRGIRNAHLILWNLERPAGSAGSIGKYGADNRELLEKRYVDEVWVSDRRLAEETELRYVTLGSNIALGEPGTKKEKTYSFSHMSYETNRRRTILKNFDGVPIGPNSWPPFRNTVLKKTLFALNIHQDVHPFQEPLRFALFAAYGLPIVSETLFDSYPLRENDILTVKYDMLVSTLNRVLQEDYKIYEKMGLRLRKRLCIEYEFGKMVRLAVSQSVGDWR